MVKVVEAKKRKRRTGSSKDNVQKDALVVTVKDEDGSEDEEVLGETSKNTDVCDVPMGARTGNGSKHQNDDDGVSDGTDSENNADDCPKDTVVPPAAKVFECLPFPGASKEKFGRTISGISKKTSATSCMLCTPLQQ